MSAVVWWVVFIALYVALFLAWGIDVDAIGWPRLLLGALILGLMRALP